MTRLPDGPVAARDAAEDEEDAEVEQPQAPRLFLAFSTSEEKPMFSKVDRTLGKDATPARRKMFVALTSTPCEYFMNIIVIANLGIVVLQADAEANRSINKETLNTLNIVLLVIYCVETIIRLYVYQRLFIKDPMRVFEALVVMVDIYIL